MLTNHHHNGESGNIVVYLLGAIILVGILTILVRGSSTPGTNINEEDLMIKVSEVQEYGQELERAVAYIMANGHSETDIRFAHPDADSAYGDITDTPTRQIFSRQGGGATYREPPSGIQTTPTDWIFNAENEISSDCTDNSCADLVAILGNITKDFCLLINEMNNVENIADNPPKDVGNVDLTLFTGVYNHSRKMGDENLLLGKMEGCFEGDSSPPSGTYHYYRVLLAR